MKLRFPLEIIYRAKSWTMCSVTDPKWSATLNSSVASCCQPSDEMIGRPGERAGRQRQEQRALRTTIEPITAAQSYWPKRYARIGRRERISAKLTAASRRERVRPAGVEVSNGLCARSGNIRRVRSRPGDKTGLISLVATVQATGGSEWQKHADTRKDDTYARKPPSPLEGRMGSARDARVIGK
jgi:hypothetical protein